MPACICRFQSYRNCLQFRILAPVTPQHLRLMCKTGLYKEFACCSVTGAELRNCKNVVGKAWIVYTSRPYTWVGGVAESQGQRCETGKILLGRRESAYTCRHYTWVRGVAASQAQRCETGKNVVRKILTAYTSRPYTWVGGVAVSQAQRLVFYAWSFRTSAGTIVLKEGSWVITPLGNDSFLPNPFQFISHHPCMLYRAIWMLTPSHWSTGEDAYV
jgi:hypothetical protein